MQLPKQYFAPVLLLLPLFAGLAQADYGHQKEKCHTVYKTVYETIYETSYKEECQTHYDKKCHTVYDTHYDTKYEKKCHTVYVPKCHTYYETIYKKKCEHYYDKEPHSQSNGFYWGHQCSWTLTPANSMQVSIMQFDNCNRK